MDDRREIHAECQCVAVCSGSTNVSRWLIRFLLDDGNVQILSAMEAAYLVLPYSTSGSPSPSAAYF